MTSVIWTIGHSNRSIEEFIGLAGFHQIELVADIRSYPASRHCPWFGKDLFSKALGESGIRYKHIANLGGRRPKQHDVIADNSGWTNASFRNYADYANCLDSADGFDYLELLARKYRVAYMCSEAQPWRCHRTIVSDWMFSRNWRVRHIMNSGNPKEHVPGAWGASPLIRPNSVSYPKGS